MTIDHYCPLCKHLMGASGAPGIEKCWNCMKKFQIKEFSVNKSIEEFQVRVKRRSA